MPSVRSVCPAVLACCLCAAQCSEAHAQEPVDLVDPLIGTVTYPESGLRGDEAIHGSGKTFPGAATPFGRVQLSPDTVTGGDNGSGYSYVHRTISRLEQTVGHTIQ